MGRLVVLSQEAYDEVVRLARENNLKFHVFDGVLTRAGITDSTDRHRQEVSATVEEWLASGELSQETYDAIVRLAQENDLKFHVFDGVLIHAGLSDSTDKHRREVSATVETWLARGRGEE